jgi:hypothetical protein
MGLKAINALLNIQGSERIKSRLQSRGIREGRSRDFPPSDGFPDLFLAVDDWLHDANLSRSGVRGKEEVRWLVREISGFFHDFGVVGGGFDRGFRAGDGVRLIRLVANIGGSFRSNGGQKLVEGFRDEGSGMGAATGFGSGVRFVDGGEGIFRIVGGEVTGKPRGGALAGFRPPLGGASFGCDLEAFDFAAMTGAATAFGHGNEGFFDRLHDFGIDGELVPKAIGVSRNHLVIEGLDLLDETGLVKIAARGEGGHGLGHLERRDQNVALADADIGDIALEDAAFVDAEHVVIIRHVTGGFGFDGKTGAASESEQSGPLHDGLAAGFEADLIEVSVAGLGHGLLEIEHPGAFFFPVAEDDVADG